MASDQHSSSTAAVKESNAILDSPNNTNIVKNSTNANGEFPANLMDAWTASRKPQSEATGVEKFLNTVGEALIELNFLVVDMAEIRVTEDGYGSTSDAQTVMNTIKTPINALLATPNVASDIDQGVNTFLAVFPPVMKALDAVGKVHPFINGMLVT
jgi:hypothetical protein